MKKILVAMSGGVDSSVAALLLQKEGYEVAGAYMKIWMHETEAFSPCPWQEDIEDAREVAKTLGIDFAVINLIREYREQVVQYLVEGYRNGTTPNPDIMCNREIKFGTFLDYALNEGFDGMATGHYCRKIVNEDKTCDLMEGIDKNKDQSYFLSFMKQEQLQQAIFPIGHRTKKEVRELARKYGLAVAGKKDSQGICFIGRVPMGDFLKNFIPDKPGEIVNSDGDVLGHHAGLHRYTLGQRRGLGIPSNTDHKAYVVVEKDLPNNRLRVAFDDPSSIGLYTDRVEVKNLHFINHPVKTPAALLAKPRYRDASKKVFFEPMENKKASLCFEKPQRALTSGQVCALYQGERLLGGGVYV